MKIKAPWKCDGPGCNQLKGETNHWVLVSMDDPICFMIQRWDDRLAEIEGNLHICGSVCAGKALEKWLGSQV